MMRSESLVASPPVRRLTVPQIPAANHAQELG